MSNLESLPLPESWVERIFATMRATYGASFDRQWECPAGSDVAAHMQAMKAHWARELRSFAQVPKAIAHALDNLPQFPPNLIEFRQLCIGRPQYIQPQLSAPKADPERVAQALASIKVVQEHDPKAWAHRLRAREQQGERLTKAQRDMWRAAIEPKTTTEAEA